MVPRFALMEVTVQVPASTTNLGPGFDCLGVALQLWNRTRVRRVNGSSTSASPRPKMVDEAAHAFFSNSTISPFEFDWSLQGDVPPARGLGSSVPLRLGVLLGLNRLADNVYSTSEIKQLCDHLEGHPDNTAAALHGGFTIVNARANVPLTAAACAGQDYEAVHDAFNDRLHEPYREPLVPILRDLVRAGQKAGALGGFLSGSGSTIACLTTQDPQPVADAMQTAAGKAKGTISIVKSDNSGARIL